MPELLGRELNGDEQTMAEALRRVLGAHGRNSETIAWMENTAARKAALLGPAALAVWESQRDPEMRRWLGLLFLDQPKLLAELFRADGPGRETLLETCRALMTVDALLDVRLARLTPGRDPSESLLPPEAVVRVLEVLDVISPGPRLILLLNHLTRHPDSRIASKATLLVGKRLQNPTWVTRQLGSDDARVRANVVEGLWNVRTPAARNNLRASLKDKNNRVVGNALIGLHQRTEPGVTEFVRRMLEDPRPAFRWTAAWVMGQIGSPDFVDVLTQAGKDPNAQVRRSAERALEEIERRTPAPPPAAAPVPSPAPDAKPETEAPEAEAPGGFDIQLDGHFVGRGNPDARH